MHATVQSSCLLFAIACSQRAIKAWLLVLLSPLAPLGTRPPAQWVLFSTRALAPWSARSPLPQFARRSCSGLVGHYSPSECNRPHVTYVRLRQHSSAALSTTCTRTRARLRDAKNSHVYVWRADAPAHYGQAVSATNQRAQSISLSSLSGCNPDAAHQFIASAQ